LSRVHSRMDTNIYEGVRVTGKVLTTLSRGKVVWHEGQLFTRAGEGRMVQLPPFGPLFNGLDKEDKAARAESPYGATPVVRTHDRGLKQEL
jgi:dihydropyrimidinase